MPKVKKFKDLSPRQQTQYLLLAKQNSDEHNYNTKCLPKKQTLNTIESCRIKVEPGYMPDADRENNIESIEEFCITYTNTKKQKDTLQQRLHIWATECNVTQKSLTALLNILREESELSSDTNNIKLEKHLPESIDNVASSSTYISASNKMSIIEKQNENINSVIWLPSASQEEEFDDINDVNNVHDVLDITDVNNVHDVLDISDVNNVTNVNDVNSVSNVNDVNDVNNCETQHDSHSCCEACHTTHKTIMKKLDFIINLINKNTESTNIECKPELLPTLPLATIEDFLKFEEQLQQDKEIRKQFKNKIAKIGGKMYKHKTRNIMKHIIHDSIAKQMSWTGQKESMAIKNTIFASIIIDYITSSEECSLYQVQKVIQEWLRHAGDRLNYLLKK